MIGVIKIYPLTADVGAEGWVIEIAKSRYFVYATEQRVKTDIAGFFPEGVFLYQKQDPIGLKEWEEVTKQARPLWDVISGMLADSVYDVISQFESGDVLFPQADFSALSLENVYDLAQQGIDQYFQDKFPEGEIIW